MSQIDALLADDKATTLEELLEEPELLQECKAKNQKLVDLFVSHLFYKALISSLISPEHVSSLLKYLLGDDLDEEKQFKYPYLVCEIINCEIDQLLDAIIDKEELLNYIWKYLDSEPPLNSLRASYFSRANAVLMDRNPTKVALSFFLI